MRSSRMIVPLVPGVAAVVLVSFATGQSQEDPKRPGTDGGRVPLVMNREITKRLTARYLLYLPDGYAPDTDKRWPLILFLHGAGERGTDTEKIARLGPLGYAKKHPEFPFIVVSPQCPLQEDWSPEVLDALLDEILAEHRVDEDRVYLTGFSMGGWGTWELAMERTERFAAIAPLCGRVIPLLCGRLWKMPIWVFHGDKDDVVPFEHSREMVGYLRGMGNDKIEFTVYPGAGHDIWERSYDRPELYAWFLKHRLSDRSSKADAEE